ncbi:MAG: BamA/TamA family outer membrane protein [Betaproteobacteria bacterium]|nr:MAG: BamA/TamA family outer membrane protein [Betaproteobacteria bacterium]
MRLVRNISPIKPGDAYNEAQLLKFQKRLLASGHFASAIVYAGSDPQLANATPIFVNVVESKSSRVELGAGMSTNRGLRGFAGYIDQNTFDRALQFDARVQIDQLSEGVVAGLTLPRNERDWRYGLATGYKRQDIQNEEHTDWSVTSTHAYLIEEYLSRQSLQLLEENRRVANVSQEDIIALYLAQNWDWNRLDDVLAPRDGYFLGLEVGGSSKDIVSDASFGRVVGKASYFLPVKTFGTLALRMETGWLIADSRGDIPSAYLFRTGGDTTVRGYKYQSLGVQVGDADVGGRHLLVGSVEYIQWLTQRLGAAVFYDAGNAVDTTSNFKAAAGYGVGVRWYSPIGGLNFDVAYGEEVNEYRIHFFAGFVFR